ncbi:hypothetical protein CPB83DRAFT_905933 [Crepidotus variabilis]|uniref:F-box domain-containing protein n=1 Tax=Crepidotus variabilis TaxID=179855 RepID=A0A9P6EIE4_9AGAR|nr:hypothetical protein CPB83DRAFT_905933 [Crepidotus variabilis]
MPTVALDIEIFEVILCHLSLADLQSVNLVCRILHTEARRIIFRTLHFQSKNSYKKVEQLNQACVNIKVCIKRLHLAIDGDCPPKLSPIITHKLFQLIRSLPNLEAFTFKEVDRSIIDPSNPVVIPELALALRSTFLTEFEIRLDYCDRVEGEPIAGPKGLKKLSVGWFMGDRTQDRGSSANHLYQFIKPSLHTLVKLQLTFCPFKFSDTLNLDIGLLGDAENLLQFDYTLQGHDGQILDIIPQIFPKLMSLTILWRPCQKRHSIV